MNQEKIFENLNSSDTELFERIKVYASDLNLTEEDEKIFNTEETARLNYYITNYYNNYISVGVHLARVKKIRQTIEAKRDKYFGKLYVEVTDQCIAGKNSSKFDNDYRTGKVLANKEYQDIAELVIELTELEGRLETVKASIQNKAMLLPTMFKLDKNIY